jgi:hypothetical protein
VRVARAIDILWTNLVTNAVASVGTLVISDSSTIGGAATESTGTARLYLT